MTLTKLEKKQKHMQTKTYAKEQAKKQDNKELKEWKLLIREQAGNKCEVCNSTGILNAHHILPKERYKEFKTEPKNGVLLCPTHHKFGKLSAHRNGIWFSMWLEKIHPEKFIWAVEHLEEE